MNLLTRFAVLIIIIVQKIHDFVKAWFSTEVKRSVPVSDDPLLKLSATVLAEKIRERKIFSQEVVQSYIKRITQVNPIINAVVEDRFEAALQDAKRIDRFLDDNPGKIDQLKITKPLYGVPITIKESIALEGLSYTGGTYIRKNVKAESDSVVVQHLKEAGVIPLLVSNTPEYCTSMESFNKIIGITLNPYNTLYTSAGSSGGEGALLGAGASVIGIGSDIAGSIRMPALFNGVFGHKPTKRIVSLEGHLPNSDDEHFQDYLVIGPMTRYAEDLKPMLKVMGGKNAAELNLDEEVKLSNLQVFYMEDTGNDFLLPTTDKEIRRSIRAAAAYLSKECHCHISNHKFQELGESFEMASVNIFRMKKMPSPLDDSGKTYNLYVEILKELFGKSMFTMNHMLFVLAYRMNKIVSSSNQTYVKKASELKEVLQNSLGDNGVLLYPCNPTNALKVGQYMQVLPSAAYVALPNLLGLPATAVPTGFDAKGMPIGIQVIAGPYQDRLCLAVAQELEKCFGGWQAVP